MSTLSVCLITKNEESNLQRALESVVGVADEIIVTDTGSTDGTVAVAEKLCTRIERFAWVDDFSAARNYCIKRATCDWILWLDADEELLESSQRELRRCTSDTNALAYFITRQDLADAAQPDDYTQMWQLRLWRRSNDWQFVGRCHPQFCPPLDQIAKNIGLPLHTSQISLSHYGYVESLKPSKLRRAARLLCLELSDRPGQSTIDLVEYGRTLLALGDPKAHEVLADAASIAARVDSARQLDNAPLALLLEFVLASPQLPSDFPLSKQQAETMAQDRLPNAVPLLWHVARREYADEKYDRCAELLERIVMLGKCNGYDQLVSFNPRVLGDDALLNLGACYLKLARLNEAERTFRKLRGSRCCGEQVERNLSFIVDLRKEVEKS